MPDLWSPKANKVQPKLRIVPVVDHLAGHSDVDADVLADDEAGLVGAETQHHVGDVQRVLYPTRRLPHGVRTLLDDVLGVDPAWGDGVDTCLSGQPDSQRVGQGGDASSIAFESHCTSQFVEQNFPIYLPYLPTHTAI